MLGVDTTSVMTAASGWIADLRAIAAHAAGDTGIAVFAGMSAAITSGIMLGLGVAHIGAPAAITEISARTAAADAIQRRATSRVGLVRLILRFIATTFTGAGRPRADLIGAFKIVGTNRLLAHATPLSAHLGANKVSRTQIATGF